jgi:cell division protein ZapA (FtsZ GTPase activity inhibitor)
LVENLITIDLFGQTYTFKTESEATIAEAVADSLVKEVARIQENISRQPSELTKLTVMILAALNFAKENNELRAEHKEILRKVAERSNSLLRRIDADLDITI